MNIKDAEKLSGLSSRNIRFYEQKGLIKPQRNQENDYRTYSQEDIERLRLIRILRMLDMPLEQIREVVCGRLTLQDAAQQQHEELRRKIEKMETAARFCEELSGVNNPDYKDLLKRMDEPENRDKLSKKWPSDYTKSRQMLLLALLAGLLPLALGWVLFIPTLIAKMAGEIATFFLSLVVPICWCCVGYGFRRKGGWWGSVVLAHFFPALICGLMEWQLKLPFDQRSNMLTDIGMCFRFPFSYFTTETELFEGYLPILLVLLICFCLGGFVAWIVPVFTIGWKQMHAYSPEGGSAWHTFWKRISKRIPVKLIVIFAVILLPIFVIIYSALSGPLAVQVTPERMQQRLNGEIQVWVETEAMSYEITSSGAFCEQFQFEQWERQYFPNGLKELELEVHLHSDRSEPYAIEFYSDGTARIYESWVFLEEGYFYVPEEVAEAVLAYAISVSESEGKSE